MHKIQKRIICSCRQIKFTKETTPYRAVVEWDSITVNFLEDNEQQIIYPDWLKQLINDLRKPDGGGISTVGTTWSCGYFKREYIKRYGDPRVDLSVISKEELREIENVCQV